MGELVPTTYARALWNATQETEMPHHDDILTAEQARRINDYFAIELHTARHGDSIMEPSIHDITLASRISTAREFDTTARVVRGLSKRDTLFMEGYGHSRPYEENWISATERVYDAQIAGCDPSLHEVIRAQKDEAIWYDLHDMYQVLEDARTAQRTNPFQYASTIARLRGFDIRTADIDAFELQLIEQLAQKSLRDLMDSSDKSENGLMDRVHRLREKRACNTVKDYALANLPPEGAPALDPDEKPRLVVLYGRGHQAGLVQNFNNLGLDVCIYNHPQSDIEERAGAYIAWRQSLIDAAARAAMNRFTIRNDFV